MIDLEGGCWLCQVDERKTSTNDILFKMKFRNIERWICLACLLKYLLSHFLQYVDINNILNDNIQRV